MKQFTNKEFIERAHVNMLDHGEPGSGKTRSAGKAIKYMEDQGIKSLVIVIDPNELYTIETMPDPPQYYKVWQIESKEDLWLSYLSLRDNKGGYGLVVTDNLTKLQKIDKEGIIDKKYGGKADDTIKAMMTEDVKLDPGNWGQLAMNVDTFIYRLKMLDLFHMLCISHTDSQTSARGETKLYPAIQGGLRFTIGSEFDIIAHSFIHSEGGIDYYCKTTRGSATLMARDRFNLGRTFIDPSFQVFIDMVKKKTAPEPTEMEKRIDKMQYLIQPKPVMKIKVKGEKE